MKTYIDDCVALAETETDAEALKHASLFAEYAPISGTPDQVVEQNQAYGDLGFCHIVLRFADFPKTEGVELFIIEVLPRFK